MGRIGGIKVGVWEQWCDGGRCGEGNVGVGVSSKVREQSLGELGER